MIATMSDADFHPCYKWLGIPLSEQPPNHCRLLSVSLFEKHVEVIAHASNRQIAHLRTLGNGKNSE